MDKEEFKKIVKDALLSKGLVKKGNFYYYVTNDLINVVGLQKSNFSEVYYINVGFLIKELHPDLPQPKDFQGDIQLRFINIVDGKETSQFDLEKLDSTDVEKLKEDLAKNIVNTVLRVSSIDSFKKLLEKEPDLLNITTLKAKKFLGYE